MNVEFCSLGSGSLGNAALLMTPNHHVLIDAGFAPDEIEQRLAGTGASWETLDAIVLTHTHGDHLKRRCLTHCAKHGVTFFAHEHHLEQIGASRYLKKLAGHELVRTYDGTHEFELGGELIFHPILIPHDCPPTFGFRIDIQSGGDVASLGYLSDLGECDGHVIEQMRGVHLLALEFNHDVRMELESGRHRSLIDRVLGREGHLSNAQAAEVFRRVLELNENALPQVLVQMHLSEECNRAELAYRAAQEVLFLSGAQTRIFSTRQDRRGTTHTVGAGATALSEIKS